MSICELWKWGSDSFYGPKWHEHLRIIGFSKVMFFCPVVKSKVETISYARWKCHLQVPWNYHKIDIRKRNANTIWYHFYVRSSIWHKCTHLEDRKSPRDIEDRLAVAKGKRGGSEMDGELGVGTCKLLHLEWINNETLLYSTENSIPFLWIEYDWR